MQLWEPRGGLDSFMSMQSVMFCVSALVLAVKCVCPCSQRLGVMQDLYDATGGGSWLQPWNMSADDAPCSFDGVVCSGGDVVQLNIGTRGLRGTLPAALSALVALVRLDVSNNSLTGTLPPEYKSWETISIFDCSRNQLSGTLPRELSLWNGVLVFRAGYNIFIGTLPREYASWAVLEIFQCQGNRLNGTLPPTYSAWKRLWAFDVGQNELHGQLPEEYVEMASLQMFSADHNRLEGTLPASYGAWSALTLIQLSSNRLEGTLPSEFANWSVTVQLFEVQSNFLSGTLPAAYGAWSQMTRFRSGNNSLTGALPEAYISWANLIEFDVSRNRLTGTILEQYCNWTALTWLYLQSNTFGGTIPDCLGGIMSLQRLGVFNNHLVGPVPSSLLLLPVLAMLFVSNNNLSGVLPPRISPSIEVLDLQDNPFLSGELPARFYFATVCGTMICPTAAFPLQYCAPLGALNQLTALPVTEVLVALSQYLSTCSGRTRVVNGASHTTTALVDTPTRSAKSLTATSFSAVAVYLSFAGGARGTVGAVPSLQRASATLRLALRCENGLDLEPSSFFDGASDNPLGAIVSVGGVSLDPAAGAALVNAALAAGIALCMHVIYRVQRALSLSPPPVRVISYLLPAGLLPGALAAPYGSLLQPSTAASVFLIGSASRTTRSVVCGVATLLLWCAFPVYCGYTVLRCIRSNGMFALDCHKLHSYRRRCERSSRERRHALYGLIKTMCQLHSFATTPRSYWAHGRSPQPAAAFLLEHMEAVFGGYVAGRHWYFLVDWGFVVACGAVLGVADAMSVSGDPCTAAQWGAGCLIALGLVQCGICAWLRPFSVRLEMWSAVGVGLLCVVAEVLAVSGMLDASDAVSTAASSLEIAVLVVMMGQRFARMRAGVFALHTQPAVPVGTDDNQSADIGSVLPTLRSSPKHVVPNTDTLLPKEDNETKESDGLKRLEALLEFICAKVPVPQCTGTDMSSLDPISL